MVTLRPYQVEAKTAALRYLARPQGGGFCLFMEQRVGKTYTACSIVEELAPARLLIVCPVVAMGVWETHLKEAGTYEKCDVQLINFEMVWKLRKKLKKWQPDFIIVDESHRIKGRQSHQSKALRRLALKAKWKLALTGTPLEGKIWDAWAQFNFIDPTVFGSWADFQERYLVLGGFRGKQIQGVQEENEEEFQLKFQSRFFRVLLEGVKEIKTQIDPMHKVMFDLEESREAYDAMKEKFMVEVQPQYHMVKGKRKRKRIIAPRVITQILKLHQLSGGFILDEDKVVHRIGDEKLAHMGELLLKLGKVPVVIFVRFIPELHRIARLVKVMGRTVTLLSGKHKFEKFETDVIVVQIRSGVSIDLSRAEEVIFYSWGHSFLDYDQAKFRIRSYTSVRARYHYMIARNTIDEDLYKCVIKKASVVKMALTKYGGRT